VTQQMFGLLAQAMLHDMTPEARAAAAAAAAAIPRSNSGLETMQSIEQVAGAVAAPAASPATRCSCLTSRVCRFTYIRPSGDGRQASPAAMRRSYMPRQGQPFLVLNSGRLRSGLLGRVKQRRRAHCSPLSSGAGHGGDRHHGPRGGRVHEPARGAPGRAAAAAGALGRCGCVWLLRLRRMRGRCHEPCSKAVCVFRGGSHACFCFLKRRRRALSGAALERVQLRWRLFLW